MDAPKAKVEGLVFGTVEMLNPLLVKFAGDCKHAAEPERFSICGPSYQSYRIIRWNEAGRLLNLGVIEFQQLPGERVLVTFDSQPRNVVPETVTDEQRQLFQEFSEAFVDRLRNLGFIPLPPIEKPKRQMGFTLGGQ